MATKRENLGDKVAKRIAFLEKVAAFACLISAKRGEKLLYSEGSCHTHSIYELHDFGDFSFHADTGKTMFGGDQVKVWYHPLLKFDAQGALIPLVLDISWQSDIDKPTHMQFNDDPVWQKEILKVIRRQKSIARQIDQAVAEAKKKAATDAARNKREQELAETATRLQVR